MSKLDPVFLEVALQERSYQIAIGSHILAELFSRVERLLPGCRHLVMVVDEHLVGAIAHSMTDWCTAAGFRASVVAIPSGESSKSIGQLERIWSHLLEDRADRKSALVAIGGGVVGDLAGFAAATFVRGIPMIQIPTTLLAMVDSSVGGKTGINLPSAKNMVGAFWQPREVWIDLEHLDSLPVREYVSGLAEVVKYGMILDAKFFDWLETHAEALRSRDLEAVQEAVRASCQMTASVVEQDERETTGLRAILNYGHTFAHAIEAEAGYGRWLHGEAVSLGMHCAATLAAGLGMIEAGVVQRQSRLLDSLGLPVITQGLDPGRLYVRMQSDKKTEHGEVHFILPDRIGHVKSVHGIDRRVVIDLMASLLGG
ncbi:MAG: 3-dehydroquinate synthase [Pirellulaceae bacterium]